MQDPYYAVIFSSTLKEPDEENGYAEMAARMVELAEQQPGYIGIESVRDDSGNGVTISYWQDLQSIRNWKENVEHQHAQELGQARWYQNYRIRICKIEHDEKWGTEK